MKPIKEIVKDKKWQSLRFSLVGKWNLKPEWCVIQLRNYLGDISKTDIDKLRIVSNYLIGTGFRIKAINPHEDISNLRKEISIELKKRKFKKD